MKALDDNGLNTLVNNVKKKFSDISADTLKGTLPVAHGGTGATTAKAANNALMGYSAASSSGPDDATKFLVQKASPSDADGAMETMTGAQLMSYIVGALPPTEQQVHSINGPNSGATGLRIFTGNFYYTKILGKIEYTFDLIRMYEHDLKKAFSIRSGESFSIGTLPEGYRPSIAHGKTMSLYLDTDLDGDPGLVNVTITVKTDGTISASVFGTTTSTSSKYITGSYISGGQVEAKISSSFPCKW